MGGLFWIILGPLNVITSVPERKAEEELSQRSEDRDLKMLALEDYSDIWLQSKECCILPKASKVNTFLPIP